MTRKMSMAFAILLLGANPTQGEPLFTVTDISNWTPSQLSTIPGFDHYPLLTPAGASASFSASAHSGDNYVGTYDGYYGDYAARVEGGVQTSLPPLGIYYWHYTQCDASDCHFYNGRVGFSHLSDINSAGVAVGDSTLAGTGSYSYEYETHAIVHNPNTGAFIDITPAATRAAATGINDAGQIVGWQRTDGATQGMRWMPDHTSIILDNLGSSVTPTAINELGVVVGTAVVPAISYFNPEPFVSESGAAITQLTLPSQGGVEFAVASDVNNTGLIAGHSWKANAPNEPLATLWERGLSGTWTPYDVSEIVDGGDFIYQRALAVNDEGYVLVQGKLDQDFGPSLLLLLNPETTRVAPVQARGDYNFDGVVGVEDYQQWRRDFGHTISPAGTGADGNGDGTVNSADYTIWRNNLGSGVRRSNFEATSAAPNVSRTAVPEPATMALLGLVVCPYLLRHPLACRGNN